MPIDYTNTINDKIMESLATIINGEFNVPVYYDEHKLPQSFLLTPLTDSLVSNLSSGMERAYEVEINYQLKSGGQYTKNSLKQVSNTMERLKKLIFSNISYSNGETWFDANISTIEYERDEEDQSIIRGIGIFSCTNIEII